MHLDGVEYRLLANEREYLQERLGEPSHVLDAEIRLRFESGVIRYVTWVSEPCRYCIGVFEEAQFRAHDSIVDAGVLPVWKPLIGREVELSFLDDSHQVLRLSTSEGGSVFLSSIDEDCDSHGDVVRVSSERPHWRQQ